ncbi:MAG: cytochrome c oxidase subunit II [Acidobacteriaceae bacterium]|nr:cytochrome c oxidase subunit II [Acidobacteriaceae bacterium]
MIPRLQLIPDSASSISHEVNLFFGLMVILCSAVATGIAIFLIYSAVRYRRRDPNEMGSQRRNYIPAEVTWIALPFLFFMGMFAWGAKLYFEIERPPDNTVNMYVVGRQWMWKFQHPEGQREINTLHIPVGRPVKLIMTSEDVIHSFFVPAFRTKQDVVPGRYETTWFEAIQPGKYHLFCAEYCGTKHSGMIGWIYAMNPDDYQRWLTEGAPEGSLASQGEKFFHQFGCSNCHHFDNAGRCPNLLNLYNHPVQIGGGETVLADDGYIRESILDPNAKIVYGYQPNIMPNFTGQISEEQLVALISYIKALSPSPGTQQPSSSGTTPKNYGVQKGIAGPGATSISGSHLEQR